LCTNEHTGKATTRRVKFRMAFCDFIALLTSDDAYSELCSLSTSFVDASQIDDSRRHVERPDRGRLGPHTYSDPSKS
jgi:hypothetical protein